MVDVCGFSLFGLEVCVLAVLGLVLLEWDLRYEGTGANSCLV